ncbi:MAG: Ig-like domain-containing protein [Rhizobacter sp.]|nr:Ig-like domain-containing protein [Ferruginibacter sp.]
MKRILPVVNKKNNIPFHFVKSNFYKTGFLILLTALFCGFHYRSAAQNTLDLAGLPAGATAKAAYSVRKLSSAYAGNAVSVRRSSDNALQDIGFTASGDLDLAALLAFVAGGDGFVTKWYDQSGYGADAIQGTAANQPKIVSAGITEITGSRPGILFSGNMNNNLVAPVTGSGYPISVNIYAQSSGASIKGAFVKYGTDQSGLGIGAGNGNNFDAGQNYVVLLKEQKAWCPSNPRITYPTTAFTSTSILLADKTLTHFLNGTNIGLEGWNADAVNPSSPLYIGGYTANGNVNRYSNARESEVIVLSTALSVSERTTLECGQNLYYNSGNYTVATCSGTAFTLPTTFPAGTLHSWGNPVINPAGAITGGSAAVNQGTVSQLLTNNTALPATATYNVSSTNCSVTIFYTVTVTVNPKATLTLSSAPGSNVQSFCAGGSVPAIVPITYTVGGAGSGASISAGALPTGVTGVYNAGVFTISGTPTVAGTFSYTISAIGPGCASESSIGTLTVYASPTGGLSLTENSGTPDDSIICAGSNITFTAPSGYSFYEFKNAGGTIAAGTANVYNSTTIGNGEQVSVIVTGAGGCTTTFGPVTITVNPIPAGTFVATENSGVANDNTICPGSSVTFTAPAGYTGYDFKVGGTTVQNNGSNVFTSSTLTNGASVTVLVSAAGCSAGFGPQVIAVNAIPSGTLALAENSGVAINDGIICQAATVVFTATAGFVNYNFKINGLSAQSGAGNTFTRSNLTSGNIITVEVNNSNGCITTFNSFTITVNSLPPVNASAGPGAVCVGNTITLTNTTPAGVWSSANNTLATVNGSGVVTGIAAGTVNIIFTVTNGFNCSSSANFPVIVNALPVLPAITGPSAVCENSTVQLANTFTGGIWSSSNTAVATVNGSGLVSGLIAGTAIVTYTYTNGNGCVNSVTKNITVNSLPAGTLTFTENSGTTPDDGFICQGGAVTFTASPGFSTYEFKIGSATIQNNSSNIFITSALNNGDVVTVIATNSNTCKNTFNAVTITVYPLPVLNAISGLSEVCMNDNITLANNTAGGSWSSSATTIATIDAGTGVLTGIAAGTAIITYTFTNGNGCTNNITTLVTVKALPSGTLSVTENSGIAGNDGIICQGATVGFTATAGFTNYEFKINGTTVQNSAANTYSFAGFISGNMVTVEATNNLNCKSTFNSITITVHPFTSLPVITADGNAVGVCKSSTLQLYNTVAGGSWSSTNTAIATVNSSTGLVTGVNPGTVFISYTYTNGNNCTSATSKQLEVYALPVATITGANPICPGTTELYTTQPGMTGYNWTVVNGLILSGGDGFDSVRVFWNGAGVKSITVNYINANGCAAATAGGVISTSTQPVPALTGSNLVCDESSGNIYSTEAGMSDYVWNVVGGSIAAGGTLFDNTVTITWTTAGTGTVSVNYTNLSGCRAGSATQLPVTVRPLPVATLVGTTAVCQNGTAPAITFTGSNGTAPYQFTYNINGGANLTVNSVGNTATLTQPTGTPGTFIYTLLSVAESSSTTCSQLQSQTATVTVNPLPTATISGTITVCKNAALPSITFTGAAGTAPYIFTYNINGGANTTITSTGNIATIAAPTGTAGTFTYNLVSVKDATSTQCQQPQPGAATVTIQNLPTASISGSTSVCLNGTAPTITFTGGIGTAPYTFTYNINGGAPLTITTIVGNTVTITAPTNASGTFIYNLVNVAESGTNTCAQPITGVSASVLVRALPTATISGSTTVCQNGAMPQITFTGSNGAANYTFTYNINGGAPLTVVSSGAIATVAVPTTTANSYVYTLLNVQEGGSNTCQQGQAGTATVVVNPSPTATIAGNTSVCQNAPAPLVTFTGAGGTSPYTFTYKINGGSNQTVISAGNIATVPAPTTSTGSFIYSLVSVQDASGTACLQNQVGSITVAVNPLPTATISGSTPVCLNAPVQPVITFTGAGGTSPYIFTYNINGGTNQTISSVGNIATLAAPTTATGTFSYNLVSVSDAGSTTCSRVITGSAAIITVNALPTPIVISPATVTLCQGAIQSLTTSEQAVLNHTFTASNNTAFSIPDGDEAGAVSVIPVNIPANAIIQSVSATFNITHPNTYELFINLKAPNGNAINLVDQRPGYNGDPNYLGVNFTNTEVMSSSNNSFSSGVNPYNGVFAADKKVDDVGLQYSATGQFANAAEFNELYSIGSGNWYLSARDLPINPSGGGVLQNWTLTINYSIPQTPQPVTWTPMTALYTDASATIPYTGTSVSNVFVKPSTGGTVTYTATAVNSNSCTISNTIDVIASPKPVIGIVTNYCPIPADGKVHVTASSDVPGTTFIWSTGETGPTIKLDVATNFTVTATSPGGCVSTRSVSIAQELVINGDFEQGNIGFYTEHDYVINNAGNPAIQNELYPESAYAIDRNAHELHNLFWGKDHTTQNQTGKFMMVNGTVNKVIWQQTVTVQPNTDYYFSAWAMNLNPNLPGRLRFEVNGVQAGTIAELNVAPKPVNASQVNINNWVRFYSNPKWSSGAATTAIIRIINLNSSAGGNDFGLDDISFSTLSPFISLSGNAGSDTVEVCKNVPITPITYYLGSNPDGPVVTGLPAGIISTWDGVNLTISGSPTAPVGVYNYTIATQGCNPKTAGGRITLKPDAALALTTGSNMQTLCLGQAIASIKYTISGSGTGASVTGLPAGVSSAYNPSTKELNIFGTPSVTGSFNFTVNTAGSCLQAAATGNITIGETAVGGNLNSPTICYNSGGTLTLTGHIGNIQRWEVSYNLGSTWAPVVNTTATQAYTNITGTTWYRAIVKTTYCNETSSVIAKIGVSNVWSGTISSNWQTGANWSDGNTPGMGCPSVHIPVAPFAPLLNTGVATINNLEVKPGAILVISNDALLKIAGTITSPDAGINATDGRLELNGNSGPQLIDGSWFVGKNIKDLVISNDVNVSTLSATTDTLNILRELSFGAVIGKYFNSNDNVTLKSTAASTASVGKLAAGNTVAGKFIIERYIRFYQNWNLLTVPVAENVSVLNSWQEGGGNMTSYGYGTRVTGPLPYVGLDGVSNSNSLKWWDPVAAAFINVTNAQTESVNRKEGMYLFARGDRGYGPGSAGSVTTLRSKGTIYNEANSPTYNYTAPVGAWVSLGNPFASATSFIKLAAANSTRIQNNYWTWDPTLSGSYGVGGYQAFSGATGYIATPGGGDGGQVYNSTAAYPNIQSGQAIFVVPVVSNPSISFEEDMKATGSMLVNRGTNDPASITMLSTTLYTGEGLLRDGNRVVFNNIYSDGVNKDDAVKLNNSGINFGLVRFTKSLAVEAKAALKASDTIYYKMSGLPTGSFRLGVAVQNIPNTGLQAELIDKFLNTRTPVSLADSSYINFTTTAAAASKAADRFMMVFKQATVLPVNFVSVAAQRKADRSVAVNWKVATEINIIRYEVERSANGVHFTGILSKDANGSTGYSQSDLSPLAADNFYRIKAIGLGNDITYSPIVKVAPLPVKSSITVYPNPVVDKKINVVFTGQLKGDYTMQLTNVEGQLIYNQMVTVNSDNFSRLITLSPASAGGHYQLNITAADGTSKTIQVLIQ